MLWLQLLAVSSASETQLVLACYRAVAAFYLGADLAQDGAGFAGWIGGCCYRAADYDVGCAGGYGLGWSRYPGLIAALGPGRADCRESRW